MSVTCAKCGADISFEGEEHTNCETVATLVDCLKNFAVEADSMWSLENHQKVCGIEVRHFRLADKLTRPFQRG